jgi:hypothetical protein
MSSVAAATVAWTLAEIDEVLGAVTASSTVGGRKKALETLSEARAKIEAKDNPKARVTIRLGERPAALVAEVLQGRSSPAGPERAAAARAGGDSGRSWCPARDEERGQSQQRLGRHARPPLPAPHAWRGTPSRGAGPSEP